MYVDSMSGMLVFENKLALTPVLTKKEIMGSDKLNWEAWPSKGDNTITYRAIFDLERNTSGNIYLIINFVHPNDMNATIASWRFAPEKLLMGEQKKPEGKVTKNLREWFNNKTKVDLPVYGKWGHIDAAYDPHNRTGTIFCNYRSSFKNEKQWKDYCKRNNIKFE
ncbi:hypothetical protein LQ939_03435 [Pantoea alhagi]|uniref:hypothetical protein n=1 Tax=Pantoea alhagi TaxID=1891675 RepID=UPI00202ADF31|nr:hypothetical protein [Pantoea alhagi]URQ61411.1 hypothetical protein LQ939_03435 [Pantoea alhagi]